MGEVQDSRFRFDFNKCIRVEGRPERLSSDAGAVLVREVEERLGMVKWLAERVADPRDPELITHPMEELLRTAVLLPIQGWFDEDDADQKRNDPAFRVAVSERRGVAPLLPPPPSEEDPSMPNPKTPDGLASQPTLSRLTAVLASEENLEVVREGLRESAKRRIRVLRPGQHRMRSLTIDVDSLPIEVHGHQPQSAYNGYYHQTMYHPLVASIAETGDLLDARLREGNCHTANGALSFIIDLLDWTEKNICQVAAIRFDAGFPEDELLSALEKRETDYVARIKNNAVLDRMAEPFLVRPVGHPTKEPRMWMHEMVYQAEEWSRSRRVVLIVQERPGELFLHHFWILTSWAVENMPGEALLELYRVRGCAEGYMGELVNQLLPNLSSSPRPKSTYQGKAPKRRSPSVDSFACNYATLLVRCLSYNLLHCLRVLVEESTGEGWSLKRVRERVLKVAARFLLHGRRVILVIGEQASELWQLLRVPLGRLAWNH